MAQVLIEDINKIYHGTVPLKKEWYEVWKPATKKADVHVVKGVNIDIKDGEFLVLVGASGCGKTTTLRMVAGLEDITSGKIFIGETLVNDLSPKDRDIAMVFQSYALYPHMNVFDNMAFGLRLRKMADSEIQKRVGDAADLLKLQSLLHRKPKELSGGQRQRVAMGRAIVRRPKVYLMDEPLSNLDAKLRVQMRAELQKLHRTLGVTTIYVTHDQTEAMTLGDRIVVMHNGIVQQNDIPLNIYERPANLYVAGFIGSPPMNFLNAVIVKDDAGKLWIKTDGFKVQVADSRQEVLASYPGREVTVGIRAEDILDRKFAREPRPEHTIQAKVDVLEPLGSEVYLYVSVAPEQTMVARVDAHTSARLDEKIELVLNMDNVHVFDKETELCVTSQAKSAVEVPVKPSGWDVTAPPADAQTSSEALRDRYIERTLEKIHRYMRHPRTRPMDLVLLALLAACLGVLLWRPIPASTGTSQALKDVSEHLDRLTAQQAQLEKQITLLRSALRSRSSLTPVTQTEPAAPPVVISTPLLPPGIAVAQPPVASVDQEVTAQSSPSAEPGDKVHLLAPGESLWSICEKYYGDPSLLQQLSHYNGIDDPSAMRVGMTIKIPPVEQLRTWHAIKLAPKSKGMTTPAH